MKTILYIEDDPSLCEVMQELLELEGFHVIVAHNGQVGLELAQQEQPDIIITDIHLPVLNARDLVAALTTTPQTARIPVLFVSGDILADDISHATTILKKPFEVVELLQRINLLLDSSEQNAGI